MLALIQRPYAKALPRAVLIELQMEHVGGASLVVAQHARQAAQGLPGFDARSDGKIECVDFAVKKHAEFRFDRDRLRRKPPRAARVGASERAIEDDFSAKKSQCAVAG